MFENNRLKQGAQDFIPAPFCSPPTVADMQRWYDAAKGDMLTFVDVACVHGTPGRYVALAAGALWYYIVDIECIRHYSFLTRTLITDLADAEAEFAAATKDPDRIRRAAIQRLS